MASKLKAVVIDSREPSWVKDLTFDKIPLTVASLPSGDAWLATGNATLIVERKTFSDLLGSIADGRLFTQVAEMTTASPWSYLVITGHPVLKLGQIVLAGRVTEWRWNSIQGALLTVQEMGVKVIWRENDSDYAPALTWLAERDRGEIKVKTQKRNVVLQSPAETLLCTLPGISDNRAKTLLEKSGTAAWALTFLSDGTAAQLPGIGRGVCQSARIALGLRGGLGELNAQELHVWHKGENEKNLAEIIKENSSGK